MDNTIVIASRISIQNMAVLATFFAEQGLGASSKSDLIATACAYTAMNLIAKGKTPLIESTEDAIARLAALGLEVRTKRNRKAVLSALAEEDQSQDIPLPKSEPTGEIISTEDFKKATDIIMGGV